MTQAAGSFDFTQWANGYAQNRMNLDDLKKIIDPIKHHAVTDADALSFILKQVKDPKVTRNIPSASLDALKSAAVHYKQTYTNPGVITVGTSSTNKELGFIGSILHSLSTIGVKYNCERVQSEISKTLKERLLPIRDEVVNGDKPEDLALILSDVLPNLSPKKQRVHLKLLMQSSAIENLLTDEKTKISYALDPLFTMLYKQGLLYTACEKKDGTPLPLSQRAERALQSMIANQASFRQVNTEQEAVSIEGQTSRFFVSPATKEMLDSQITKALCDKIIAHLGDYAKATLPSHDQTIIHEAVEARIKLQIEAAEGKTIRLNLPPNKLHLPYPKLDHWLADKISEQVSATVADSRLNEKPYYQSKVATLQKFIAPLPEYKDQDTERSFVYDMAYFASDVSSSLEVISQHEKNDKNFQNQYEILGRNYHALTEYYLPRNPETLPLVDQSKLLKLQEATEQLLKLPKSEKNLAEIRKNMIELIKYSALNPRKLADRLKELKKHPHLSDEDIKSANAKLAELAKLIRAKDKDNLVTDLSHILGSQISLSGSTTPTDT